VSPGEAVGSALGSLGSHKLRSILTMLGMIFGVGAVIAMLSIGEGAERRALSMIERLGLRNVLVRDVTLAGTDLQEARKKSLGVSFRDADAIEQAVPGVELISPRIEVTPYKVLAAGGKTEAQVFGVSDRHAGLLDLELAEGLTRDQHAEEFSDRKAITYSQRCLFYAKLSFGDLILV
jgi:putative ABC transport system permease protein